MIFDNHSAAISFNKSTLLKEDSYQIERINFNTHLSNYWRPLEEGKRPAILLLPAIWGDRYLEGFARKLVNNGFICLQMSSSRYLKRLRDVGSKGLDSLAEVIRYQLTEADQTLNWLIKQEEVDPDRIGVLGISIGAIIASLLTEQNENIEAAAYLLGGGNLPEIMVAPQGYVKKRLREQIMTSQGLTLEAFKREAIKSLTPVDPLQYAGRLDPNRIFMVNGRFDHVIPYENAKELWEALGQPTWLVLPAGHYSASFFLSYIRHRVKKHFVEQLGVS